jgi:hypothetical protein
MSSQLYDLIRDMTSDRFEQDDDSGPVKPVTFRPSVYSIHLVDSLAKELAISRQAMLDHIIDLGVRDAIQAFCDAHGTESINVQKQFAGEVSKTWLEKTSEKS